MSGLSQYVVNFKLKYLNGIRRGLVYRIPAFQPGSPGWILGGSGILNSILGLGVCSVLCCLWLGELILGSCNVMIRHPQISRLAKSRKIKKLKKIMRNMFLNQIKHIVGFDSRIFVNLPISANFEFYSRNFGEFNKNHKFTAVLKCYR